jgi:integrase
MQYEKRENKDGIYYSFVWYDTTQKRRIRLTRGEILKRFGHEITTEEEAKNCIKLLEAQYQTEKVKIERRLSWEKEFYDFKGLLEQYEKSQKKTAPNSWQNSTFYLKHYVLPFFLTHKKLNNVGLWEDYFDEYVEWLEKSAVKIRSKKMISYSSKNHAIKALNTFLNHLYLKKLVHRAVKCGAFPEHLIGKRTLDDVVYPHEMESVYEALLHLGYKLEAVFFRYQFFSGMRFSEGLAISIADIFPDELPSNQPIAKKLEFYKMKYHGYIVSESQVDEKFVRCPFKGKKEISERYARTIPICDKKLWNDLVDLAEERYNSWNKVATDRKSCFLFRGIDDTTSSRRLQEAFESCKLKYRSWHCLRHSRATWLIGETSDESLARAWLGHSSPRIFERYNHLYQALVREAKSRDSVGKEFKLKRVS